MSLLQAILMGVIQGLTEFLPVSSSGHLALFKILFNVNTDTGLLYDVLLHVGTLAAICVVYYKDLAKMIVEGVCLIRDAFVNTSSSSPIRLRTLITGTISPRRLMIPLK